MFNPEKRLGDDEGEEKRPGMTVAVLVGKPKKSAFDPAKRLGDEYEEDEEESGKQDPEQSMKDAAEGICKCVNVSTSVAPRLASYLQAFFYAADSLPHDEGESPDSEEN